MRAVPPIIAFSSAVAWLGCGSPAGDSSSDSEAADSSAVSGEEEVTEESGPDLPPDDDGAADTNGCGADGSSGLALSFGGVLESEEFFTQAGECSVDSRSGEGEASSLLFDCLSGEDAWTLTLTYWPSIDYPVDFDGDVSIEVHRGGLTEWTRRASVRVTDSSGWVLSAVEGSIPVSADEVSDLTPFTFANRPTECVIEPHVCDFFFDAQLELWNDMGEVVATIDSDSVEGPIPVNSTLSVNAWSDRLSTMTELVPGLCPEDLHTVGALLFTRSA